MTHDCTVSPEDAAAMDAEALAEIAATRSAAARALGSARSPRKAATSRANIAAANAVRDVLPCDCGRTDGSHAAHCPVKRRARWAARQQAEKEGLAPGGEQAPSS